MEIYVFSLLGVMVLTVLVFKAIYYWAQCYSPAASTDVKKYIKKQKQRKELSVSKRQLVQLEIPMEDMERTSTPVPKEEKKFKSDIQSDV